MLNEAFLRRLDAMKLNMHTAARGGAGGERRSKALGTSVEFSDFREYAAGDDLRRVDWNAYARFERLFLKLFMEEQETQVHLLLDASASMGFEGKWSAAVQLCEILAYLALRGGDKVTVYLLRDTVTISERFSGRSGYVRLDAFLQQQSPHGSTHLSQQMPALRLQGGRGRSILISDLMSPDGYETALQALLFKKQEASVLQVLSPFELSPAMEGMVRLIDSETGEARAFLASGEALERYRKALKALLDKTERFCHAHSMHYAMFVSDARMEEAALRALSRTGMIG